jgi:RNA polymerase sigma-70 factor (ECF subfamily)
VTLVEAFFAALSPEHRPRLARDAAAAHLASAWAAGRAAWPAVSLGEAAFAAHVAGRLDERGDDDPGAALGGLDGPGLYLAAAVLGGDPAAASAIAGLWPSLEPALRQLGADRVRLDELRQRVLEIVLVGDERGPAIASYGGRAELRSWLRSVAVRTALKAWARDRRGEPLDDDLAALADDPRLAHLKATYAGAVVGALRRALLSLAPRARTLLRLHYLDGVTLDDLGRMYGVHRATAARWLAAARDHAFEETRLQVEAELGLGEDSAVSVVRLVQSQLVLSLHRLLGEPDVTSR